MITKLERTQDFITNEDYNEPLHTIGATTRNISPRTEWNHCLRKDIYLLTRIEKFYSIYISKEQSSQPN